MNASGFRLAAVAAMLLFALPVVAQVSRSPLRDPPSHEGSGNYFLRLGERQFSSGHPERALAHWQRSAYWGHKIAQYNLGLMYLKGVGTARDPARGLAWLTLAAERGDEPLVRAAAWARAQLGPDDVARAETLARDTLSPLYADAVALPRARTAWLLDTRSTTGTHTGHAIGPLGVEGVAGTEDGMNRQRRLQQRGPYAEPVYPRVELGDLRSLEARP